MFALKVADILHNLWVLSMVALILGALFLLAAYRLEKKQTKRRRLLAHIARDVGIACIVAVVVTGIYELHMRTILETEKMEDVLATVLKYNVPKNVWDEVNKNVLKRDVIRRNVEIEFEVKQDKSLPPGLAFLSMKYSYDLYRLKSNSSNVQVQHAILLDYNDLAGFDEVLITDPKGKTVANYKWEEHQQDGRLKVFNHEVHLEPSYDFKNDRFDDSKAVHVINERTEIINLPGTYVLGIPELMEGTNEKPIKVHVKIPANLNIEPVIDTQWSEHAFTFIGDDKEDGRHSWVYTGILLPGQFFDIRINQLVTSTTTSSDQ
jgi:hypothetical protein